MSSHRGRLPLAFFHELPSPLAPSVVATLAAPNKRFPGDSRLSAVGLVSDTSGLRKSAPLGDQDRNINIGEEAGMETRLDRRQAGDVATGGGWDPGDSWRKCVVTRVDAASGAIVVEWEDAGGDVSSTQTCGWVERGGRGGGGVDDSCDKLCRGHGHSALDLVSLCTWKRNDVPSFRLRRPRLRE